MLEKIRETAQYLESRISVKPEVAIVLGSGLGGLVKNIEIEQEIPYREIPNFPVSNVAGHKASMIFGRLNGRPVMVMSGRFHYYEGHPMKVVTFPIFVMNQMGIKKLVLSNAAGGMNPTFDVADIMIITDHINMMANNPLLGPNIDELGPRFPDMSEAYSRRWIKLAKKNWRGTEHQVATRCVCRCYRPLLRNAFRIQNVSYFGGRCGWNVHRA